MLSAGLVALLMNLVSLPLARATKKMAMYHLKVELSIRRMGHLKVRDAYLAARLLTARYRRWLRA